MSANEKKSKYIEYHDGLCWFIRRGNVLTLGLTEDAIETMGEADDISLPEPGSDCDQDDVIVEVDGSDGGLSLVAPVSGVITEVNKDLKSDITILNDSPTDDGWMVRIEFRDEEELKDYL